MVAGRPQLDHGRGSSTNALASTTDELCVRILHYNRALYGSSHTVLYYVAPLVVEALSFFGVCTHVSLSHSTANSVSNSEDSVAKKALADTDCDSPKEHPHMVAQIGDM